MNSKLPDISSIRGLSAGDRAAILDLLFEPSTQLHTLSVPLLHEQEFRSYDDLISAVGIQLTDLSESPSSSDTVWLEGILGSHPRLGAKKVESAQSQAEQAQLQGTSEESDQLRSLNEEYERRYPGLRYVVFVNGRSRPVIMEDMRSRIANGDIASERAKAIRVSKSIPQILTTRADNFTQGYVRNSCRSSPQIGMKKESEETIGTVLSDGSSSTSIPNADPPKSHCSP